MPVVCPWHGQGCTGKEWSFGRAEMPFADPQMGTHATGKAVFVTSADPKSLGPLGCMGMQIAVVGIEELPLALVQEPSLDAAVALQRAVAIEMIRRQRCPDANAGPYGWRGFDLIAAEFHHNPFRPLPLQAGEC
mgnify:CR=1 FL=1